MHRMGRMNPMPRRKPPHLPSLRPYHMPSADSDPPLLLLAYFADLKMAYAWDSFHPLIEGRILIRYLVGSRRTVFRRPCKDVEKSTLFDFPASKLHNT